MTMYGPEDRSGAVQGEKESRKLLVRAAAWMVLVLISAAAGVFAIQLSDSSMPVVALKVRMTREQAIKKSAVLARRFNWEPINPERAATFEGDPDLQNYLELEKGTESFSRLVRDGPYSPFTWSVRLFREHRISETWVYFTPEGAPYGFTMSLPEDQKGAKLQEAQARELAEQTAHRDWSIDLKRYAAEESHRNKLPDRVDYSFTYRMRGVLVGGAPLKLDLDVSGDRLSGITHYVDIPDSFNRRFTRLQSFHDGIASGASVAAGLLYGVVGCGFGLVYLIKRRSLAAREALIAGAILGGIAALAELSSLPLAWLDYDTSTSRGAFLGEQALSAFAIFLGTAGIAMVVLMIAEGLTRRAFGEHIQFWKLWGKEAASTRAVFGRTAGAYLWIPIDLAFVVGFYLLARHLWGWQVPSSLGTEPDALAKYFPWLSPISDSAAAGIIEEAFFRAVPLAGAAILGRRFDKQKLFIGCALVLQAVIFAAAHADYPGEPPYSRLIELMIPAIVFGAIYLRFGLLPGIIAHFGFDLLLFSTPLFSIQRSGAALSQIAVITAGLLPLVVVGVRRLRAGSWNPLAAQALNRNWIPRTAKPRKPAVAFVSGGPAKNPVLLLVVLLGVGGSVWWTIDFETSTDARPVTITRRQAEKTALSFLKSRGIDTARWEVTTTIAGYPGEEDDFVVSTAGTDKYKSLLGKAVMPPAYVTRLARFSGSARSRSETHEVTLDGRGSIWEYYHALPEEQAGMRLTEDQARQIARAQVERHFRRPGDSLPEVKKDSTKQERRTDWLFEFQDAEVRLKRGQARYAVEIGGDQVVDAYAYVYIPENYYREKREEASWRSAVEGVASMVVAGLGGTALVLALIAWAHKRFSRTMFWKILGLGVFLAAVELVNAWPDTAASLDPQSPKALQLGMGVLFDLLAGVGLAFATALLAGWVFGTRLPETPLPSRRAWLIGAALGPIAYWIGYLPSYFFGSEDFAWWPDFSPAGTIVPALGFVGSAQDVLTMAVTAYLIVNFFNGSTLGWTQKRVRAIALFTLAVVASAVGSGFDSVPEVLTSAGLRGALGLAGFLLLLRKHPILVVPATGAFTIMSILDEGLLHAFPGWQLTTTVGVIAAAAAAVWLFGEASKPAPEPPSHEPAGPRPQPAVG